jgi:hypothetical protein
MGPGGRPFRLPTHPPEHALIALLGAAELKRVDARATLVSRPTSSLLSISRNHSVGPGARGEVGSVHEHRREFVPEAVDRCDRSTGSAARFLGLREARG